MSRPNLEILNVNSNYRAIEDYFERFDIWCLTHDTKSDKMKVAHFLNSIGQEAYALVKDLLFPESPINVSFEIIQKTLLQHVRPIIFEAAERSKYHCLTRGTNEPIRDFILKLQTQAAKCSFGDQLEIQLRDRLVAGINNPVLHRQLLLAEKPTFQSCRSICEHFQDVSMAVNDNFDSTINPVFHTSYIAKKKDARQYKPKGHANNQLKMGTCHSCGQMHSREKCKFRNATCYKCGKSGHIKTVCKSQVCAVANPSTGALPEMTLMSSSSHEGGHIWRKVTAANGESMAFILDTGSVESILPKHALDKFAPESIIQDTDNTIIGITGHSLDIIGCAFIDVVGMDSKVTCKFLISNAGPAILGLRAMKQLKVQLSLYSFPIMESELKTLISQCSKCTGGMRIPKVKLDVSGDPIFLKRRIISFGLCDAVKKAIMSLVERDILTPVKAAQWGTPIVTPLKSDGCTPRICGDYRLTLNRCLLQMTCTTPEPERILYKFKGSIYFSKIDLKDAYLQIPLDDESSMLTVINTPFGLFLHNFLPFGLNVAPAIFQDTINAILVGLHGVEVYQDDIFVHGSNRLEHDQRLLSLFRRFATHNVAVNPSKCNFAVRQFDCLGFTVDEFGFSPNKKRLHSLVNVKSPSNVKELRSIMGAIQYYSRFVPNFAKYAVCLFDLHNADILCRSAEHEASLRQLLSFLNSDAVLRPFSAKLHSTVITDASPTGIAAVLEQEGHPILCISRRLSKAESGYAQTHREALAVFWAVTRLHKYLFGQQFTIASDHEPLKFIYNPAHSLSKSSAAMVQ